MNKYLSHFSAAKIWDIPNIETVLDPQIEEITSVHITVSERNKRYRNKDKKFHSYGEVYPSGAITIRDGKAFSSPELMFLELASELSMQRLILLGLQLCSHKAGCSLKAITTKQNLKAFLAKTSGHRGHMKALQAIKYIENDSASIMESIAFMILTLPHTLGGYGLNGAVFNYGIKLKNESHKHLEQNQCFVDIYYKQAKLAVEYDSFTHHCSPAEQGKDAIRSAALERQGIKVMHLSTIQLYDKDACRDFAYNLATRLGKRMQIRTKKFNEMNEQLRSLLPVGKPALPLD